MQYAPVTRREILCDALPEPPRWVWLWLPPALFTLLLVLALRDDSDADYSRRWWAQALIPYSEYDFIETATAVASALGVIAGIAALRHRHRLPTRWLRGWMVLVTLGCAYVVGEETTFGQYCFGWCWGSYSLWDAPAWWPAAHTNLHSLTQVGWDPDHGEFAVVELATWFDKKPRLLLELFALGGIFRVLLQRGDVKKGDWRIWFWPTYVCLPCALLAILARMPDRLDWLGFGYAPLLFDPGLINWQSLQELFFALFLLFYLWSIWYRLMRGRDGTGYASTDTGGSRQEEPSP